MGEGVTRQKGELSSWRGPVPQFRPVSRSLIEDFSSGIA